jgi:serine/threonine protein kinase
MWAFGVILYVLLRYRTYIWPPEVVSGASLSSATDMWAFGVILYVLLGYRTYFWPPEVVSGAGLSSATDIWAFGVILYVLLRYRTYFWPPEVVSGAGLSSATDMWAFGHILYSSPSHDRGRMSTAFITNFRIYKYLFSPVPLVYFRHVDFCNSGLRLAMDRCIDTDIR